MVIVVSFALLCLLSAVLARIDIRHGIIPDVNFLAAAGIWIGIEGLPMLVLVAALTALVCAGLMQLAGRQLTGQTSLSFGPFLAIGLLFTLGLQQQWPCC